MVAELIYSEFFSQGDLEKALGVTPSEMMDRDRAFIPEQQLSFIDNIAGPVYKYDIQIVCDLRSLSLSLSEFCQSCYLMLTSHVKPFRATERSGLSFRRRGREHLILIPEL